jgi:uncharacterized tellurite resistance protein B-like protein
MFDRLLKLIRSDVVEDAEIDVAVAAAALMFEVVWADHDIGQDEMETMSELLQRLFSLTPERVIEIVKQTKVDHDTSVGVFPFTRALNEQLSQQEKFLVLRAMWSIALADEQIDSFEEHTIRRIADLMYVSHHKFIEAKLAARADMEA